MENHSITSIGFFLFFFVSDQNLTLEELLKQRTTRVLSPSSQRITVRRSHILDDAVGALRCGFVETKRITIHFLGESAIDEGGPRREFFMLLMGCIANNSSIFFNRTTRQQGSKAQHQCFPGTGIIYSRCAFPTSMLLFLRLQHFLTNLNTFLHLLVQGCSD